jgi:tellurite methyltransferase
VLAQAHRLRAASRLGPILDLACGRGRHALSIAAWGPRVVGLDRDPEALAALRAAARGRQLPVSPLRADAEHTAGLPFLPGSFGAVVVTRFLFRPLAPILEDLLRPGGLLLYETFTWRQRDVSRSPRNPSFLLGPWELPGLFPRLRVVASWEGLREGPRPEWVATLVAYR